MSETSFVSRSTSVAHSRIVNIVGYFASARAGYSPSQVGTQQVKRGFDSGAGK